MPQHEQLYDFGKKKKMIHNVPQTAAEVVLGIVYILVVSVIITSKRKVFCNAFYILFVTTGIADILAIYMSIFFRIIRPFALGPGIRPVISFFAVLSAVTYFGHLIGNMIIALNRYSAICLFDKYDKIWRRRNVWIIVALQSTVAFIAASPLVGAQMVYSSNADGTYQFIGLEQGVDLVSCYTVISTNRRT
ncbi:hypothetical protein TELCIR_01612 [Teladorsagia circumcincta]|uniref:G-protein coupled receptors family 1 profile domain-containing protein n=1 Tax=Teladorsagia circumcincta TaxID=45464 RepID=A0A2G9V1H6_TELCI|nr:hypothetical protein TELCIR_01612 [Teladorsagia circumcincta]